GAQGVSVESGTGNSILGNSVFSNKGLGIDLDDDGVTLNDLEDPDTGANNLQNFPVITAVVTDARGPRIQGMLNSTPNTKFRVELFESPTADRSGFGQGMTFLSSTNVMTNNDGNGTFTV